ncbi:hypothetical protein ABT237_12225 [Streptomyces sp. NPDC001581]|uniref:hypothetical protein n=1 Tax=Streptomyces sp. NPDC001581 TaxID=3154386 RepID=UPI00331D4F6D
MIPLSVDPTSQSWGLGQTVGTFAVAAVALAFFWRVTRPWRNATDRSDLPPAERKRLQGRRNQVVVLATVVITLLAAVKTAGWADPDTGAAEPAAREPARPVTISAPEAFSGYRLITGPSEHRDRIEAATNGRKDIGQRWYYDKDGDRFVHAFLMVTSFDPARSRPTEEELGTFFTATRASDVTPFEPGPAGGKLSCGHVESPDGAQAICAWGDTATFGALRLADTGDLPEAARTTTALRTATVR